MIKRILISMIISTLFLNTGCLCTYGEESKVTATWNATGKEGGDGQNISGYFIGERERALYYGGRNAKVLSNGDKYFYALSDTVTYSSKITVEYYDLESSSFRLGYGVLEKGVVSEKESDIILTQGTKTWKSVSFDVERPIFGGQLNFEKGEEILSADFYIKNTATQGNVLIGKITVERSGAFEFTADFKSTVASNVYNRYNQSLNIEYKNRNSENAEAYVDINIFERDYTDPSDSEDNPVWKDDPVWNRRNIIALSSKETKIDEINPNLGVFGIYKIEITVYTNTLNKNNEFKRTQTEEFSVINSAEGIKNERMNINQEFGLHEEEYYDDKLSLCEQAGFGSFRIEEYWSTIEKVKGERIMPDAKTSPENLAKLDFTATFTLGFGNPIYNSEASGGNIATFPKGTDAKDAFVEYVRFVVKEYATKAPGKVKYYSLWNEFNLSSFNKGGATNREYAEMLKRVYPIIKEEDPNAEVIAMVACADDTHYNFIKDILDNGTYNYFDAISYHPYCFLGTEHITKSTALRDLLERYRPEGAPKKELYYTECGYPTSLISEKGQADYAVKLYVESLGNNLASKLWWYDLVDKNDYGRENEAHFGLIKNPKFGGGAKYAYISVAGMNKFMYDAEFKEKLNLGDNVSAYSFQKGEYENIAVLWANNSDSSEKVRLNLDADTIHIYDVFTNEIKKMSSGAGTFDIDVTSSPIYVKYSSSAKSDDNNLKFSVSGDTKCAVEDSPKYWYTIKNSGEEIKGTLKAYSGTEILYNSEITVPGKTEVKRQFEINNPGRGDFKIYFEFIPDTEPSQESLYSVCDLSVSGSLKSDVYKVTIEDNVLKAVIHTTANTYTTIMVTDQEGKIVYINQETSDSVGRSEITGFFPYKGLFNTHIFTGDIEINDTIKSLGAGVKYELKRKNEQTGKMEVINASDIKDNDNLVLSVKYYNYNKDKNKTNIYSVLYNESNIVNNVMVGELGIDDSVDFEIRIDKADKVDCWKIYIWGEDMSPLDNSTLLLQR